MNIVALSSKAAYLILITLVLLIQGCGATPDSIEKPASKLDTNHTKQPLAETKTSSKKSTPKVSKEAPEDESVLPQRIALMPFGSQQEVSDEIMFMLRQSVFSHLSSTNYMLVRPQEVDQRILLHDKRKNFSVADVPVLTSLLEADAIIISNVISSDVTYVGVAAQIYYKVEVSLVSKSGKVIWSDIFSERSIEGGFSADPFSLLYSLAVTAMHVGKENMFAVADKIGRQVASSIPQPEGAFTLRNLTIESVIHDGTNKSLKYGDTLKVGVKAPPNMLVNLSIENISELFNAKETEPGTYFIDIPVNSKWNGQDLLLTAYVLDQMGNRARKISHLGLLNFDNKAPAPVSDIQLDLLSETLSISWHHSENNLNYSVYEIVNNQRVLIQETSAKKLTLAKQHEAFKNYEFAIVATDKAGNTRNEVRVNADYLPFNTLKQSAIIVKSKLPLHIKVDSRLTKKHSPYLVDSTVTVASNSMLFIEPGVVLEFTQTGTLEVQGSLSTFGLTPVVFKSINDSQQDQSFIKINTQRHVALDGFVMINAGIGIEVIKGKPKLQNCEINNSNYSALSISRTANVEADNCNISGSNTSAVVVADSARLSIKNSQFSNNFPFHIQNSSTYSVDARNNQWQPSADAFTILGNVKY